MADEKRELVPITIRLEPADYARLEAYAQDHRLAVAPVARMLAMKRLEEIEAQSAVVEGAD